MLYVVGLGLKPEEVPTAAYEIIKKCDVVFAETYTSFYPWDDLDFQFKPISRDKVESEFLVDLASRMDVCLLVPGDPLAATTHISLVLECIRKGVDFKIVHAPSIFTAIAESGLSLYKFGKTASIPKWEPNYKPRSFAEIIRQNQKINAHTLLLIDPKLRFDEAKRILKEAYPEVKSVIAVSIGKRTEIRYGTLDEVNVGMPACLIVPAKLEPYEEEALELISKKFK